MFLEDLKQERVTPIVSLDLLHLCNKAKASLDNDQGKGSLLEVLGLMARSYLMLYRFLEWQEHHGDEKNAFRLSLFVQQELPRALQPKRRAMAALFQGTARFDNLERRLREFVLARLPEAFASRFDARSKKRSVSFESRLAHHLDQTLNDLAGERPPRHLSDLQEDLSRENIRRMRRELEEPLLHLLEQLLQRIERQCLQVLGRRGVASFIEDTHGRVNFLSLLGIARGSRGDHLLCLNQHSSLCAQLCRDFSQRFFDPREKRTPSAEDLYLMGLLHDLGQAMMISHLPEVQGQIWEHLSQLEEDKAAEDYALVEQRFWFRHQVEQLSTLIRSQTPPGLVEELRQHLPEPTPEAFAARWLLETRKEVDDETWATELWKRFELPQRTPLKSSWELAAHLLRQSAEGQEFVQGAYEKFAKFVNAYGHAPKDGAPLHILVVRYANDLCQRLSKATDLDWPCVFTNIGGSEVFDQKEALAQKLGVDRAVLDSWEDETCRRLVEDFRQTMPAKPHQKAEVHPLLNPQRLLSDLHGQIGEFFRRSRLFRSGFLRYQRFRFQIETLMNEAHQLSQEQFLDELQQCFRHFFRTLDAIFRPRGHRDLDSPAKHFAVLFESDDFDEDLHVFHYRHILGDLFLLDSDESVVNHEELSELTGLLLNELLLQHCGEFWENLKVDSEAARLDQARIIADQAHLGQGFHRELLYFKARLLDRLLQRYTPEREAARISKVQFAIWSPQEQPSFEMMPTEDFLFWQNTSGVPFEEEQTKLGAILSELSIALSTNFERGPSTTPVEIELRSDTILVVPLMRLDLRTGAMLILIVREASLKKEGPVIEAALERGLGEELRRTHSQSTQPAGLTLLHFFASDDRGSALSQITHLRPSRLKEIGVLLLQTERETRSLQRQLPPVMLKDLQKLLEVIRIFWQRYQDTLRRGGRLSNEARQHFEALRQQSEHFKKSMRMKIPALCDLLLDLPSESFGKLRLGEPKIYLPWGLDHLYLSPSGLRSFVGGVERKISHGHPQLRSACESLHKLESAWMISHPEHLRKAFTDYFEELSQEGFITGASGPTDCTVTVFLHEQDIPHLHHAPFQHIVVELFIPSSTREGGYQRLVANAGAGYNKLMREGFNEFCTVAHRNVLTADQTEWTMECFYRRSGEHPSVRYVEPHLFKHRFMERTGISTLFFFPCRSTVQDSKSTHRF